MPAASSPAAIRRLPKHAKTSFAFKNLAAAVRGPGRAVRGRFVSYFTNRKKRVEAGAAIPRHY
jgi:hypothetical protein